MSGLGRLVANLDGDRVVVTLLGREPGPVKEPDQIVAQVRMGESYSHLPQRGVSGTALAPPLRVWMVMRG